jgi:hypothetical protein
MGAVCYQRFGCPELGVCTSGFELLSHPLGPLGVEGPFSGYKDV